MPADRTKSSKTDFGNEAGWPPLVDQESMPSSALSFAANITPIDFSSDTPPPLFDPPTEFILFPPTVDETGPRRQPHSKKKPENHIPRPPNAFILFRSSFIKSQHVSTEVETNHSTLSKIIGITWQNLPDQERQIWHQKAKEALEEHKRKFPKYAFRPMQTKVKGAASEKRKVREVEPKDIKRCEKIAQLLVEGKKGQDLQSAVQEFDKHHVPEIVTRFEAPITARSYRRSSSAPIPDTENTRAQNSFFQTVAVVDVPKRKPRAASSRPTRCSTPISSRDRSSSVESVVEQQAPPLKEELSLNFGGFSFDSITPLMPNYECDPLGGMENVTSFAQGQFHPSLSINTDFLAMSDWAPSPSPMTPDFLLNHASDPMACASFATSFDTFEHVPLEKSIADFAAAFPVLDQTCAVNQPQDGDCGLGANVLYPYHQLGTIEDLMFMDSIQASM